MDKLSPSDYQWPILENIVPLYSYEGEKSGKDNIEEMRNCLSNLLGDKPKKVPLNKRIEYIYETSDYTEIRMRFSSEENCDVPCHLLLPTGWKEKKPLACMICLQGHSSGMHISLGRNKYPGDEKFTSNGCRSFALQAVEQGYAALTIEQRCLGERKDVRPPENMEYTRGCHSPSMTSLLLGRTMIGERVWDVQRAIDLLETIEEVDNEKIGLVGTSGGGTTTFFSMCMDSRVKSAICSCYICSLKYSIGKIDHCDCNYIPGFLKYFDLGDLAYLMAPRPLVVVSGREDPIFPYPGVQKAYSTIEKIYSDFYASQKVKLVTGDEGHQFYPELAWPVFNRISGFKDEKTI